MSQKNHKQAISTHHAPQAIGPYSQAIRVGDFLFISGQIPLDPSTGKLIGSSVADQTRRVMLNLSAILSAASLSLNHVVKTTVYLQNLGAFSEFNEIYQDFLEEPYPARATIEISKLPMGALVEIDAIACYSKD